MSYTRGFQNKEDKRSLFHSFMEEFDELYEAFESGDNTKTDEDPNKSNKFEYTRSQGTNVFERKPFETFEIKPKKTEEEKAKEKKIKENKKAVKEFIKQGKATLKRLKKAGAEKEHLDSLYELLSLYKNELKNDESKFDWSQENTLQQFKNKVVPDPEQTSVIEDLFYLRNTYPQEQRQLDYLANWVEPLVFIAPARIQKIEVEHTLPELKPVQYSIPYGSDITIKDELSIFQKYRYEWDKAVERFKEVNKDVDDKTLHMWIRKQLINGWKVDDAVVPNIRDIEITPVTYYWAKKPFEVWHIKAYSYNDAYATSISENYKGFWYWITPIYEEKGSSIQKYGAISEYNNQLFNTYTVEKRNEIFAQLLKVSGNQELYNDAINEQPLGTAFIKLVKDVQSKFWPGNRKLVNGILTPETLSKVNAQIEEAESKTTTSYKDDRETLIVKLFYISGNKALYQAAIKEKINNDNTTVQKPQKVAFEALVRSAREVLYGPAFMQSSEIDSQMYKDIDAWGKTFNGNAYAMDNARVYRYVQRDYDRFEIRRQEIQIQLRENGIKMEASYVYDEHGNVKYFDYSLMSKNMELQNEYNGYTWEGLMAKYSYLRTASDEYKYIQSDYPVAHDKTEYPTENPFIDKSNPPNRLAPVGFSIYNSPLLLPVDPDKEREVTSFYDSFTQAPQSKISSQTFQLEMSMHLKRTELLLDPALATNSVVNLYANLFEAYKLGLQEEDQALVKSWVNTIPKEEKNENLLINTNEDNYHQKDNLNTVHEKDTYSQVGYWKYDEFKRLCNAVSAKADELKNSPSSTSYLFYSNTSFLFNKYKESKTVIDLTGLRGEDGGAYNVNDLLGIAGQLVDMIIMNVMLKKGSIMADDLKDMRARKSYLDQKEIETGDARTVPAYLVLDAVEKDPNTYIHDPDYRVWTKKENDLVHDGIPLNMFLQQEGHFYKLYVDVAGKLKSESAYIPWANRDMAIAVLLDNMQAKNIFPNAKIYYLNEDRTISKPVKTRGDHWTWSEILTAISIGLMVLAIPFTLGGSAVAASYLAATGLAVGIIAEGVGLYEKWEAGTLTGTDVAISGLSVLAMLLPGAGLLGKTMQVGKTGGRLAFLEGKQFIATTVKVEVADALVQGYVLTDSFIERYNAIPANLSPSEREKAVMELMLTSLALGMLNYHSAKCDIAEYRASNIKSPEISPDYVPTERTRPLYNQLKSDGFTTALPDGASYKPILDVSFSQPNGIRTQYTGGAPSATGGNIPHTAVAPSARFAKEYSITNTTTGVTTKYTKTEFVNNLNSGKFDNRPDLTFKANTEDVTVQNATRNYCERNGITVGPGPSTTTVDIRGQDNVNVRNQTQTATSNSTTTTVTTNNTVTNTNTTNVGDNVNTNTLDNTTNTNTVNSVNTTHVGDKVTTTTIDNVGVNNSNEMVHFGSDGRQYKQVGNEYFVREGDNWIKIEKAEFDLYVTQPNRIRDNNIKTFAESKGLTDVEKVNGRWQVKNKKGNLVSEWEIDLYGNFSKKNKGTDHFFEAHHGIQDYFGYSVVQAFCERLGIRNPYKSKKCPAILLRDTFKNSPHGETKTLQEARDIENANYEDMQRYFMEDLDAAGVPDIYKQDLINQSNAYYKEIYEDLKQQLINNGESAIQAEEILKGIFGNFKP